MNLIETSDKISMRFSSDIQIKKQFVGQTIILWPYGLQYVKIIKK